MKLIILNFFLTLQAFAIIGGKPLLGPEDGVIFINFNGDSCTATKVGEKTLITAAHCVLGPSPKTMVFQTQTGTHEVPLTQISIHPSYSEAEDNEAYIVAFFASDVAIIEIIPNEAFEKLPIVEIDFSSVQAEDEVSFIGFGCQKSINDITGFTPTKKIAVTQIAPQKMLQQPSGVEALDKVLQDLSDDPDFVQHLTYGQSSKKSDASLCLGDSGGPLLRQKKIIGINSSYTFTDVTEEGPTSGVSFFNLHARLDLLKEWVLSHLQ